MKKTVFTNVNLYNGVKDMKLQKGVNVEVTGDLITNIGKFEISKDAKVIDYLKENEPFNETTIGMKIAPKINSCGRMSNAYIVVDYFLTSDFEKKHNILSLINEYNALSDGR